MRSSTDARHDVLSPALHDGVALDEIELYAEVLAAAARSDRPLDPDELDRALGVRADRRGPAPAPEPRAEPRRHPLPRPTDGSAPIPSPQRRPSR